MVDAARRAAVPDTAPPAARARAGADTAVAPPDTTIPAPVGFVNDRAGVMDEADRSKLEYFLDQLRTKTGVQFAVLVLRTTAPLDPVEYKTGAFQRWFHGNRQSLLLLVAMQERKIQFETGYELEGILPDALEARIVRQEMTPRFRSGDYGAGITAAVLRVSAIIAKDRGVTLEWEGKELRYTGGASGRKVSPLLLAFLVFIILFVVLPILANSTSGTPTGRRRRGSWWLGPGPWIGGGGLGGGFGGFGGLGGGGGGGGFGGFSGGGGFGSGGGGGGGGW